MADLEQLVSNHPKIRGVINKDRVEFLYALEMPAVDEATYGELTRLEIGIRVSKKFIREFNLLKYNKDSTKLPNEADARVIFEAIRPTFKGRKLKPIWHLNEDYRTFDEADEELSTYRGFHCHFKREGRDIVLNVVGDLELDEEYDESFAG
ncbi:hypothetical protein HYW76_02835 [Candidatus Pacearchaeota archaeon]|nr:hypothetical protein [Candidatus Pacearchaeota archaeon]